MPSHSLSELILLAPPLLFALTIHEFAHGCVASFFGDPTAKMQGRLTLNPLKHLDPIGTLAFFFISFGWARPVPVNPNYFRNPRKDMLWVALAGPATNIALAVLAAVAFHVFDGAATFPLWARVVFYLGLVNIWLAAFNLIPIPPLDGSVLVERALPAKWWPGYLNFRRYALPLVVLVIIVGNYVNVGGEPVFQRLADGSINWWITVLGGH